MSNENCDNKYNYMKKEYFGNRKKVSSKLLNAFGENDIYLKKELDDVKDKTDPESRISFSPVSLDSAKSYGVMSVTKNNIPAYAFNNATSFHGSTSFKNYNNIDRNQTTAFIDISKGEAIIPPKRSDTVDISDRVLGPWGGMIANEFWYVSYKRYAPYDTKTAWLEDNDSKDIPAVCRAQTFKPKKTGYLSAISLNIKGSADAQYPLIVEIFDAETVPFKKLAYAEYKFSTNSDGGMVAIPFKDEPLLTADHRYSFRLRSPLTTYEKRYALGGWSKYCQADPYANGDAWLSEDNGYNWIPHGKEEKVSYHQGKRVPQDFGFQLHMRDSENVYDTTKPYYVYFNPIILNPVKTVQLNVDFEHENDAEGKVCTGLKIEVSRDGKTWTELSDEKGWVISYDSPYKQFVFIRAALSTTYEKSTPHLQAITLLTTNEEASKAYLRTQYYLPPTRQFLSPQIWSKVYAPSAVSGDASVVVDIIRNVNVIENITLITVDDIINYISDSTIVTSLNTTEKRTAYLETTEGKALVSELSEHNIYFNTKTEFNLQYFPSYPMIYVQLQKADKTGYVEYHEWYDFEVDYDGNTLTFYDTAGTKLSSLPAGTLSIEYYPCWIKGLTMADFESTDNLGLVNKGFKMDLMSETFVIGNTDSTGEDSLGRITYKTKVLPMAAIRELLVYPDTEDEAPLEEGVDFTVDYQTGIVTFLNYFNNMDLSMDAIIKYTPFLIDTGLSIGYRLERTVGEKNQAFILPNWFDFRT